MSNVWIDGKSQNTKIYSVDFDVTASIGVRFERTVNPLAVSVFEGSNPIPIHHFVDIG